MTSLDGIFFPITLDEFLEDGWGIRPIHIKRRNSTHFASLGIESVVSRVLEAENVRYPAIRVYQAGSYLQPEQFTRRWTSGRFSYEDIVDTSKVMALLASGATVSIRGMEQYSEAVLKTSQSLERLFGGSVAASAFLSPPGADQRPTHTDDTDGLVLQVAGAKRWSIWSKGNGVGRPDGRDHECCDNGEGRLNYLLRQGDTLYVPRDYLHQVESVDTLSVHVVFNIHTPTWRDLMRALIDDVVNALEGEEEFRRSVRYTKSGDVVECWHKEQERIVRRLQSEMTVDRAFAALRESRCVEGQPPRKGGLTEGFRQETIENHMHFRIRDIMVSLRPDSEDLRLSFFGKTLVLPRFTLPALAVILGQQEFSVETLREVIDQQSGKNLVRRLYSEGLILKV